MAVTAKGWPYVVPSDTVTSYPTTSLALANKAEATVPHAMAAGSATITVTSSTTGSVAVTYPVSRFSASPIAQVTFAGSVGYVPLIVTGNTSGMTVRADHWSATVASASIGVQWSAQQMLVGAGPGMRSETAVEFTATCRTPVCGNLDAPITLEYEPGEPPGSVQCGVCGQPITDHTL